MLERDRRRLIECLETELPLGPYGQAHAMDVGFVLHWPLGKVLWIAQRANDRVEVWHDWLRIRLRKLGQDGLLSQEQ